MADGAEQRLCRAAAADEAERRRLLVEWNATAARMPAAPASTSCSRSRRRATPDAVAVVFGDERLTYARAGARANQLAHHLRALGVGPETRVGAVRGALAGAWSWRCWAS